MSNLTCDGKESCEGTEYCGDDTCMECCPHDEKEHFQCIECGKEFCPGEAIDAAEIMYGDER